MKKLTLAIGILALILISIPVYYFYKGGFSQKPSTIPQQVRRAPAYPTIDPNRAIPPHVITSLTRMGRFRKGVITSSVLTSTYKGKITEWDTSGKIVLGQKTTVYFELEGTTGNKNTFSFSSKDLNNARIVRNVSGKEEPIKLGDIKVGDSIEMTTVFDLLLDKEDTRRTITIKKL